MSAERFNTGSTMQVQVRTAMEAATLILLLLPVLWILIHWNSVPVRPLHMRGSRASLFVLPAFAGVCYRLLGESGLFAHMDMWRPGSRFASLRSMSLAYFLSLRLELIAFLAVLSLGMCRAAITGLWWPVKGLTFGTLALVGLTLVVFVSQFLRRARSLRALSR